MTKHAARGRSPLLARRELVVGAFVAACSRKERPEPAPPVTASVAPLVAPAAPKRGATNLLTWSFELGKTFVIVPAWGAPSDRYPVLIALHGRGEALKGPDRGGQGWPSDYALTHVIERICEPPLTSTDLEGFVDPDRLARQNRELAARPFGGLVIACPYVPDLDLNRDADLKSYGRFVIESLLPRLYKEAPTIGTPESTGIDGVSLGGAVAMRVGLARPEMFGAVGGIQPALRLDASQEWTEIAKGALAKRPKLKLRLLTSTEDYFRPAVEQTSAAWQRAGITHEMATVVGPHDYPFNRGPGSVELLMFHDRALRA